MGSNAPGAFLVFNFFGWSLSPDLQFSLGQTNTHRVFATQVLSDRTIVCTLGRETVGSNAPRAFLVMFMTLLLSRIMHDLMPSKIILLYSAIQ